MLMGKSPAEPATKVMIEDILGPSGVLIIVHRGEEYRLRITSNGKLLLTK
jgi:hemin uptake protein HemP